MTKAVIILFGFALWTTFNFLTATKQQNINQHPGSRHILALTEDEEQTEDPGGEEQASQAPEPEVSINLVSVSGPIL